MTLFISEVYYNKINKYTMKFKLHTERKTQAVFLITY